MQPHPELSRINGANLRTLLTKSFQQRRKMLRASLKDLLLAEGMELYVMKDIVRLCLEDYYSILLVH